MDGIEDIYVNGDPDKMFSRKKSVFAPVYACIRVIKRLKFAQVCRVNSP